MKNSSRLLAKMDKNFVRSSSGSSASSASSRTRRGPQIGLGVHVPHQPGPAAGQRQRAAGEVRRGRVGAEPGQQVGADGGQQRRPGALGVGDEGPGRHLGGRQGRGELLGTQCREVGGERGHRRSAGAPCAVLEGGVQPAVRLVADGPRPQVPDDVGGGRLVGDDDDRPDDGARDRGGHGVGQQRQHEVAVRGPGVLTARGQRTEPGLGHDQPLRGDHDRPAAHRSM
jgi:hypothetical protein